MNDSPHIKQLLVLWLFLTTEVGEGTPLYFGKLTDAHSGPETCAQLAQALGISVDIVNAFVAKASSDAYINQIQDVQSLFHDLVSNNDPADYSGPECPHFVKSILDLLPQ